MPSGYEDATMLNLLIYGILADHPASAVCQEFIEASDRLLASSITLIELFFVTTRIYGIEPITVLAKVNQLIASPLGPFHVAVHPIRSSALCGDAP